MQVEEGMVVLDAVFKVQESQAPDLAVRWNCKAGKCGSCSAEINGYPKLMCMTRLDTLPEGPVTVNPMKTFPVIKDLVTDVSYNYEKARAGAGLHAGPAPRGRPPDDAGGRAARAGVPQVHRVLHVPERLPRGARPRREQAGLRRARGSSCATPSSTCTRSTPSTSAP